MKLLIAILFLTIGSFAQNPYGSAFDSGILYGCGCDSTITTFSSNEANQLLGWDRNPFESNKPRVFRYNNGKLVWIIGYWMNGNVHEVIQIKNNMFDGIQIGFYDNGNISAILTWKHGTIK